MISIVRQYHLSDLEGCHSDRVHLVDAQLGDGSIPRDTNKTVEYGAIHPVIESHKPPWT